MNQHQTHSSWHQQQTHIQTSVVTAHTLTNTELLARHNLLARSAIALNDQQMQELSLYQTELNRRGLSASQSQKNLAFLNNTFMSSWSLWQQIAVLTAGGILGVIVLKNLLAPSYYAPMPYSGGGTTNNFIIK
ncbi:MAG: hypothetical protein WBA77_00655 [Microcoleaceae cyanobacterium]